MTNFNIYQSKKYLIDLVISDSEPKQIKRAFRDLARDLAIVTGDTDICTYQDTTSNAMIIVGTTKSDGVIGGIIASGQVDISSISGKWECYQIDNITLATGQNAIIIIGSDIRGAIYGIYSISRKIGVSPFHWYADVTPTIQDNLSIIVTSLHTCEPSVKYRGIFINDERNWQLWSEKFCDEKNGIIGTPNKFVYEKIFELLLRLNANTLCPAMHPYSTAFNTVEDSNGIPVNAQIADDYGVVISTSHCEIMLRNNVGEWDQWVAKHKLANPVKRNSSIYYDYTTNPEEVLLYWKERVDTNCNFENIFTLGMRAIHDGSMSMRAIPNASLAIKIKVMNEIICKQREILKDKFGDNMPPQIYVPYKETAELYNGDKPKGIRGIDLPDDVTIMWADDNHGYIRQHPSIDERARSGGSGVYYHVSYWGDPCCYLWINTTPLAMIYNELARAFNHENNNIWIINVGDLKPAELILSYIMAFSFDMSSHNANNIDEFVEGFGKFTFELSDDNAHKLSHIMSEYYRINIAMRPEFQCKIAKYKPNDTRFYSLTNNGDEGARQLHDLQLIHDMAQDQYNSLSAPKKDCYYEMVLYPILASLRTLERTVYWQKNQLSYIQKRYNSIANYRKYSEDSYSQMFADLDYYNNTLAGGKWAHSMTPYPPKYKINPIITYRVPQIVGKLNYKSNNLIIPSERARCVIEGEIKPRRNSSLSLSNSDNSAKFIDIYNNGRGEQSWTATTSNPSIILSATSGKFTDESRIFVNIDWANIISGVNTENIIIKSGKLNKVIKLHLAKSELVKSLHYFTGNKVRINATDYSLSQSDPNGGFNRIPNLCRTGDAMMMSCDINTSKQDISNYSLSYDVHFDKAGKYELILFRVPNLNEGYDANGEHRTIDCAIRIDNSKHLHILKGQSHSQSAWRLKCEQKVSRWRKNVLEHAEKIQLTITVPTAGKHTISVIALDNYYAFDTIVITKGKCEKSYFEGK